MTEKRRRPALEAEQRERLRRLYVAEGRSIRDCAAITHKSEATIRRRLKAAGIAARPRTRKSKLEKVDRGQLFGLVAANGMIATAERFGMTRRALQIYLAKLRAGNKADE